MRPLKKSISIVLDEPVLEKIRQLAEIRDRSVSSCINIILREYLEKNKPEEKL